ncbi:hypothetical protein PSPO01_14749 [Paraphaeosphaeria sporulosa]
MAWRGPVRAVPSYRVRSSVAWPPVEGTGPPYAPSAGGCMRFVGRDVGIGVTPLLGRGRYALQAELGPPVMRNRGTGVLFVVDVMEDCTNYIIPRSKVMRKDHNADSTAIIFRDVFYGIAFI